MMRWSVSILDRSNKTQRQTILIRAMQTCSSSESSPVCDAKHHNADRYLVLSRKTPL